MTGSMQLIREFCDGFINPEKAARTRIVMSLIYNSIHPSYSLSYLQYFYTYT